jgi:phenylpropionate dioxygenase-like ring-hydroxylating dioxygenase large terminal subunit
MKTPENIFDPAHYSDVRLPIMEASLLPPWCYTSREFYEREVREIFMKTWNLVGRVDQIPSPGDYFTVELVGVEVIVLCDENREVRTFANTCRHRGCRLLTGEGHCEKHVQCPYHSWTYAFDGQLVGAPGMKKTINFDQPKLGLFPIRHDSWEGFIFICFDDSTEKLMDYLGDFPERFAQYNFSDMVCTRRKEIIIDCNWKLLTENAMEGFHTGTVHRDSLGSQKLTLEDTRGQWVTAFHESGKSIATLPGEGKSLPRIQSLSGRAAKGTYFLLIYPCSTWACNQDGVFFIEQHPGGPARTRIVLTSCFPKNVVERTDFDEIVDLYYHRIDASVPEDIWISEEQQAGLTSTFSTTSRLSSEEPLVHSIANWVLDRVLDDQPASALDAIANG